MATLLAAGLLYWQFYLPSPYLSSPAGSASIAVVPFQRPPGVGDGLDELLVTRLSQVDGVLVMGPSTVQRYRSAGISMAVMGRLQGLHALVEGSIRPLGDQLRFTARLVDVHTGKLIWAQSYDVPAADSARAQADIVSGITTEIAAHLAIHTRFR